MCKKNLLSTNNRNITNRNDRNDHKQAFWLTQTLSLTSLLKPPEILSQTNDMAHRTPIASKPLEHWSPTILQATTLISIKHKTPLISKKKPCSQLHDHSQFSEKANSFRWECRAHARRQLRGVLQQGWRATKQSGTPGFGVHLDVGWCRCCLSCQRELWWVRSSGCFSK